MIRHPPSSTLFPYPTLFRSYDPATGTVAVQLRVDPGPELHVRIVGAPSLAAQRGGITILLRENAARGDAVDQAVDQDRKSTRLNSSHLVISYAVFCFEKKNMHNSPSFLQLPKSTPLRSHLRRIRIRCMSSHQSRHKLDDSSRLPVFLRDHERCPYHAR